jgi:hypothetical protein
MPVLTRKPRARKPPLSAGLNLAHKWAPGLRYALAFNEPGYTEGGVRLVRNHAYPLQASTTTPPTKVGSFGTATTDLSWVAGPPFSRQSLRWASSTTSYVDLGQNDNTTGEMTWLAWMRPTSLTGLLCVFGQNKSDGSESCDSIYLESSKVSWWTHFPSVPTTTQILNGTATLSTNTFYRCVGRRSGAAGAWTYTTWINETQDDTATNANQPGVTTAADGNFRVGFAGAYTGAPFVGDYYFFGLWTRALPDSAIRSLSLNPWQLWSMPSLAPAPRRGLVSVGGGEPPAGNRRRRLLMCAGS